MPTPPRLTVLELSKLWSGRFRLTPYGLLSVWLAIEAFLIYYWKSQRWDYLEDIPLLILILSICLAQGAWLGQWSVLSSDSIYARAMAVGVAVFVFCLCVLVHLRKQNEHLILDLAGRSALAVFSVSALVAMVLAGRGYSIVYTPAMKARQSAPEKHRWQFAVADWFWLTAAMGVYLALAAGVNQLPILILTPPVVAFALIAVHLLRPAREARVLKTIAIILIVAPMCLGVILLDYRLASGLLYLSLGWFVIASYSVNMACLRAAGYRLVRCEMLRTPT